MYKKNLLILFGGQSEEHNISLLSSVDVVSNINREKYNIILIGINRYNGRWMLFEDESNYLLNIKDPVYISLINNKNYLSIIPGINSYQIINLLNLQPLPKIDIVFPITHGSLGENGSLQGLLDLLDVPYVGSKVLGSAICINKDITKFILKKNNIPVISSITLFKNEENKYDFDFVVSKIGLPFIIKPSNQGSSIGVSKIDDGEKFHKALNVAFGYSDKVLIEKFIYGREMTISVLGYDDDLKFSVCAEVLIKNKLFSFRDKYTPSKQSNLLIPAKLDSCILNKILSYVKKIYLMLNCQCMARIDFFLVNNNELIFNEVNTIPGCSRKSIFSQLWEASGLNYCELLDYLITISIKNFRRFSKYDITQFNLNSSSY